MEMEYTYGVARIRALEGTLFTDEIIDQLIQCESYDQCLTFLREKGWGNNNMEETLEEMLEVEREKTNQVLKDLVKDSEEAAILTLADEFHNLKAAIKKVCTDSPAVNIYVKGCSIEIEALEEIIRNADYDKLPDNMVNAAKEATEILLRTGDGSLCDVIIDKACLEAIKKAGQSSANQLVKKYADSVVTIANIKTAVRCAATNKDSQFVEKCLVPCDGVSVTDLISAVDMGLENVCQSLEEQGYGEAVVALKKSKSVFECWCDNRIINDIKPEKYNSFTIGPIIAYAIARNNEIKTVKIILSGKQNNFDNQFIKERVRIMYA